MLSKIAKKIVKYQIRYPKKFVIVFIILNLLLIPGIFNLFSNVEPSLEKVLPQEVQEIETMNFMRSQFGADMIYIVVYTQDNVVDTRYPEYLRYLDLLSQKLMTRENVLDVQSLADVSKDLNNQEIPSSITQSVALLKNTPQTYSYTNDDYSLSVMKVQTNVGSSAEQIDKIITQIKEDIDYSQGFNPGTRAEITGTPAIDRATFNVIISDFATITLISMAGVGLIVFLTFKSLLKGMLPMAVVMNALIWTMGIVGYLNLTITVVSMVAAAMIMGLGIDFGIHQVHNYYEERKTRKPKEALSETMQELLRAMIGASFTTMAGFLALLFGVLPAMKTLGIILAIGIFNTLIGAIFLLPVLIYLYDTNQIKKQIIKTKKVKQ
jgi:hypothetical protein